MDLSAVPANVAASCCKVRVWYGSETAHHETYLAAENQLHQEHGATFFKYVAGLNMDDRPSAAKETTPRPPTLEKLQQEHEIMDSKKLVNPKIKAAPKAAAAGNDDGEESDSIDFGELPADEHGAQQVGVGTGSLKNKRKTPAQKKKEKMLAAAAVAKKKKEQEADAGSVRSSTKLTNASSRKAEPASDDEMSIVIEAHLRTGGTATKSLEGLIPKQFLMGMDNPKLLTAALNGARGLSFCGQHTVFKNSTLQTCLESPSPSVMLKCMGDVPRVARSGTSSRRKVATWLLPRWRAACFCVNMRSNFG